MRYALCSTSRMSIRHGFDNLPDSLGESATARKLEEICALDLAELESVEPPRGLGDVAEGFMLDLAVLAEGSAQQMGVVGGVFELASGGGYMDGAASGRHQDEYNENRRGFRQHFPILLVATHCTPGVPKNASNSRRVNELNSN